MIISANGIVLNEYSDVLLVQRDDTRTLAPPGGACEIDELPPDAAAREVREETGLTAYPVRLVGLYYLPTGSEDFLFLCYRCIGRDGDLTPSDETPHAGFFSTNPLPRSMLPFHKEQIESAFNHSGGPPDWAEHRLSASMRLGFILLNRLVYPWLRFRRSRLGLPAYSPPPDWQVRAALILRSAGGEILLLRDENTENWSMPMSEYANSRSPWKLAEELIQDKLNVRATIDGLSGIYLRQGEARMEFVFTAAVQSGGAPSTPRAGFFAHDALPENLLPEQRNMITDALEPDHMVTYKLLK